MKIQYTSDLHLDMSENRKYINNHKIRPVGDILILAGDICKMCDENYTNNIFDYFSNNWELVIIVPGNHEYYNADKELIEQDKINKKIRENVLLVNNDVITYKDVNIICTTLWSKLDPIKEQIVVNCLNDFRCICNFNGLITPSYYNELYEKSVVFLKTALLKHSKEKNIVVTHHAPTLKINAEKYKNSNINSAFCTEMSDFIYDNNITYWIYGHTHHNKDVIINDTKIVSNQFGYWVYSEHQSWLKNKMFEI